MSISPLCLPSIASLAMTYCFCNSIARYSYFICSRPAPWRISSPSWNASGQLVKLVHNSALGSSSGWFLQKLETWLLGKKNYELLQSNNCLLGCERVMETRMEFHFSWVYTFSAMLSSLRNWANDDRYRLRPSTPAQLCWSSSRQQPLQNNNLIKFTIIRPSTLNHDRNLWNCRGAPDETTCLTVFFSVSQRLSFNLYEIV